MQNIWNNLISKFNVPFDILNNKQINKINFVDLKKKHSIFSIDNFVMFLTSPITFHNFVFRLIPNFPEYAISNNGKVLDLRNNTFVEPFFERYIFVTIYCPSLKKKIKVGVHRLVGLAWLGNFDYLHKPYINHKDGDKTNNYYLNLEWVSSKANTNHAFNEGLIKTNEPCKLFDIIEQKEILFRSYLELSRFILKKDGILSFNLAYPESLVKERYEIRKFGDERQWFYKGVTTPIKPGRYKISFTFNGETKVFFSVMETSRFFNLGQVTMKDLKIFCKKQPGLSKLIVEDRNPPLMFQAKNLESGTVTNHMSSESLGKLIGISGSYIKQNHRYNPEKPIKKWLIKSNIDQFWPEPKELQKTKRVIKAYDVTTKSSFLLNSIQEAQKYFNLHSWLTIKTYIENESLLQDRFHLSYH